MTLTLAVPTAHENIPAAMPGFLRALGARIGLAVELLPACSYAGLEHAVEAGVADLVWAPPLVALDLVAWRAASVVAAVVRGGVTAYPSVLVARRDGRVRHVADLAGARVAWVSRLSAAGHVVPRMHLESLGLPQSSLGAQEFLHGHGPALDAVELGRADVAASYARRTRDNALVLPNRSPHLHVIAIAGWVPSDVVMATRRIAPAQAIAVGHALSRMQPAELAPLAAFLDTERFAVADDGHLDDLRALTSRARVGRVASEPPTPIAV